MGPPAPGPFRPRRRGTQFFRSSWRPHRGAPEWFFGVGVVTSPLASRSKETSRFRAFFRFLLLWFPRWFPFRRWVALGAAVGFVPYSETRARECFSRCSSGGSKNNFLQPLPFVIGMVGFLGGLGAGRDRWGFSAGPPTPLSPWRARGLFGPEIRQNLCFSFPGAPPRLGSL